MKCLNPLQKLIDELNQEKKLHSQLAQNAENERQSVENGYADFEKGVVYGFELAIEKVANFQFWNDARTNPPKFDENRKDAIFPSFICVVQSEKFGIEVEVRRYAFYSNEFYTPRWQEVLCWQELPSLPKGLLK